MRIGLLTTSFPRHERDVAGRFVLGFARALADLGHALEVLAPEPAEPIAPPRWPGIRVRYVPYLRPRRAARTFYGAGVPDNLARDPLAWLGPLPFSLALLHAAARHGRHWDALVSHFALPGALVAAAVRARRPHLCVTHSADLHLLSRLPQRAPVARAIAAGASRLSFVSQTQRERFLGWLPPDAASRAAERSCVQPMGVEPAAAPRDERAVLRRGLGLTRFTLLSIGRLVPVKGLREAVAALSLRHDIEWLIAGEGPERAALEAQARATPLRVRLLGNVTGDDKQRLLHAADAFVLPSRVLESGRSEGVPTALLEAMAAGLPALAADVGGVSEVVRHLDTGLLFDPSERGALGRCIDRLSADRALSGALGARARAQAARHAWSAIGPRLESWLR